MALRISAFLIVAAALTALLLYSQWTTQPLKVSGFIEADEIRIGSRVGGRVQSVSAQEGTRTEAGEVLVVLEPYVLFERRAEAEGRLKAAQAEYDRLKAGFRQEEILEAKARRDQLAAELEKLKTGPRPQEISAAAARLEAAAAEVRLAEKILDRTLRLFRQGATTQDEMDRASEQRKAAEATRVVRQEELSLLREGTRREDILAAEARLQEAEQVYELRRAGYRPEEIAQAKAAVESAEAALRAIDAQIAELTIRAPVDGVVEAVELQPGDLVSANAPILSLMDTSTMWMRAYVPQTRLDVQTGQQVVVTVDSFPGRRFAGEITFISRQAEFTPSNVQTPEERAKQVFRIKVTLREGHDVLRPGMSGDVLLEAAQGETSVARSGSAGGLPARGSALLDEPAVAPEHPRTRDKPLP